jgi:hypothetical protein
MFAHRFALTFPPFFNLGTRYIAYAGLQFDVKKTLYGRYIVLLYATVAWSASAPAAVKRSRVTLP